MIPDFFLLGVGKSGTTALADDLGGHPEVCLSEPKEPYFFSTRNYERHPPSWYGDRYLAHCGGQEAVGEASSENLFVPFVPERIHRTAPGARLIAMLRHPTERAFAHSWMFRCFGMEELTFPEAVRDNLRRLREGVGFSGEEGNAAWYREMEGFEENRLLYRC